MINVKQNFLFKKEIFNLIKDYKGYHIDCTYGKGGISKIINKKLSKVGQLFAYEIREDLISLGEKGINLFNACFTNIKRLKLNKKVSTIIIDIGVTENELLNQYNKNALFSFNKNKSISESMNFSSKKVLDKVISSFVNKFKKKKFIKEAILSRKRGLINHLNNFSSFLEKKRFLTKAITKISRYEEIKKISEVFPYLIDISKKGAYIIVICFSSDEVKLVKKLYKLNKSSFYHYVKFTKVKVKKTLSEMIILKRNGNSRI
ncbi:16S rRNA (cytosine(1402)-N(4))-methyltransferase [Candidatus Vidania fulgoroideorum]